MTELKAPSKQKRPAMACVLTEREASLLEQHGINPGRCGRNGHRHVRFSKASLLVHLGRFRWVYPPHQQARKGHTPYLAEIRPKEWQNVVGATGYTCQQMVEGGLRA